MIIGTVTEDREITVPLELIATGEPPASMKAVIDTGFNGSLTLPFDTLRALGATAVGTRRAELGDGKIVEMDVYLVKIKWRAEVREVLALQAEATPLIGMSMLWGNRVIFDAQDGGAVTIDSIP